MFAHLGATHVSWVYSVVYRRSQRSATTLTTIAAANPVTVITSMVIAPKRMVLRGRSRTRLPLRPSLPPIFRRRRQCDDERSCVVASYGQAECRFSTH
jgi:hypothetical protein